MRISSVFREKHRNCLLGSLIALGGFAAATLPTVAQTGPALAPPAHIPPHLAQASGSAVEQSVREFNEQWLTVIQSRDTNAIGELYTNDALWMPPRSLRIPWLYITHANLYQSDPSLPSVTRDATNNQAIQNVYEQLFQADDIQLDYTIGQILVSESEDMAVQVGTYRMQMRSAQGPFSDRGRYTRVLTRVDGNWRIAVDMFNSDMAPL
ncbi:YybH family protein [Trichothermofontia sp.]